MIKSKVSPGLFYSVQPQGPTGPATFMSGSSFVGATRTQGPTGPDTLPSGSERSFITIIDDQGEEKKIYYKNLNLIEPLLFSLSKSSNLGKIPTQRIQVKDHFESSQESKVELDITSEPPQKKATRKKRKQE